MGNFTFCYFKALQGLCRGYNVYFVFDPIRVLSLKKDNELWVLVSRRANTVSILWRGSFLRKYPRIVFHAYREHGPIDNEISPNVRAQSSLISDREIPSTYLRSKEKEREIWNAQLQRQRHTYKEKRGYINSWRKKPYLFVLWCTRKIPAASVCKYFILLGHRQTKLAWTWDNLVNAESWKSTS